MVDTNENDASPLAVADDKPTAAPRPPLHERRGALENLGLALRSAETRLCGALRSMDEAESWFQLCVPRTHQQNDLFTASGMALGVHDHKVSDLAEDLRTCANLTQLRQSVKGMLDNNRRLSFVTDLMLAALAMVHDNTESVAHRCIQLHLQNCEQMTSHISAVLSQFPRSKNLFAKAVS